MKPMIPIYTKTDCIEKVTKTTSQKLKEAKK